MVDESTDARSRTDLTGLLGHLMVGPAAERLRDEYGLEAQGDRSLLGRAAGVELAADGLDRIVTVFLHFHGDDGFTSFAGPIPGAGDVPATRTGLRTALGEPDGVDDPYADRFLGEFGPQDHWRLPGFVLHAQYALDGERLHRITLKLP